MKLQYHVATSLAVSGMLYAIFRSWGMSAACLLTGVFIDLDHFIDYVREHGFSLDIKRFFSIHHKCQFDRIILLGHGWEWLFILCIAAWITEWNLWLTGAAVGYGQHMILDAAANSSNLKSYSLLWKWKNNFHFDTIFSQLTHHKYQNRKYCSEDGRDK